MELYTKREENINTLTHWIGTILVSLGSGCLITLSILSGSTTKLVAILIYSISMMMLYSASTLYHHEQNENVKQKLKIVDHCSIYFLIAGTYTPFLLINLQGLIGTIMLIILWSMALGGTIAKVFFFNKFKKVSLAVYLVMGWIVVFAIKPLIETTNVTGLIFLVLGGLFYSGGTYFYAKKNKEFSHAIWHVFVLLGTIAHFFAVLFGCLFPIKTIF